MPITLRLADGTPLEDVVQNAVGAKKAAHNFSVAGLSVILTIDGAEYLYLKERAHSPRPYLVRCPRCGVGWRLPKATSCRACWRPTQGHREQALALMKELNRKRAEGKRQRLAGMIDETQEEVTRLELELKKFRPTGRDGTEGKDGRG